MDEFTKNDMHPGKSVESAVTHNTVTDARALPAFALSDDTSPTTADKSDAAGYAASIADDTYKTQEAVADAADLDDAAEDDDEIQPPFPQKKARELKRLPLDMFRAQTPSRSSNFFKFGRGFKAVAVVVAIAFAAAVGFLAAGLIYEHSPEVVSVREHRRQVLEQKQAQIDEETMYLEQEKRRLELNKELLEAQKKNYEREESRLAGKHERLYDEESETAEGFVSRLLDKVTGRQRERREEIYRTEQERQAVTKGGDEVDKALRDAQATLDDVNDKLAEARALKKDIDNVRSQIEAAYAENKDLVDSIMYYTRSGAAVIMGVFDDKTDELYSDESAQDEFAIK